MGLAEAEAGRAVMIPELSASCSIPKKFLEQILLDLKRHELLRSMRREAGRLSAQQAVVADHVRRGAADRRRADRFAALCFEHRLSAMQGLCGRPAFLGLAGRAGTDLRTAVRRARGLRSVARHVGHQDHLRRTRYRARHDLRHLSFIARELIPLMPTASHFSIAGGLEQVGPPDDILDRPATPFVAGFVGDAVRLPVTVEEGWISLGGGKVPAPFQYSALFRGIVHPPVRPRAGPCDGARHLLAHGRRHPPGWFREKSRTVPGGESLVGRDHASPRAYSGERGEARREPAHHATVSNRLTEERHAGIRMQVYMPGS